MAARCLPSLRLPLLLVLLHHACAFYLPGLAPVSFCETPSGTCQSEIKLFVNRLDSVESLLPYEYVAFDFCTDADKKRPSGNLGQVLFGERIESSPYKFNFKIEEQRKKVCRKSYDPTNNGDRIKVDFLKKGIMQSYCHHWIIDNMPVSWCVPLDEKQQFCNTEFQIGYFGADSDPAVGCDYMAIAPYAWAFGHTKKNTFYLFNHVDITITYHEGVGETWEGARLAAARLVPRSIKHTIEPLKCHGPPMEIAEDTKDNVDIIYSYSLKFEKNNNIKWASRWDYILEYMRSTTTLWFSIMNSLLIVLFLSGIVAVVMLRTHRKDIARYNQIDSSEDAQEEFGWKVLHGDIFRPPKNGMLLSVFLGQGTQNFSMMFITLFLDCLGFLSPANRGALMTCTVVLWVLLGTPAGYVSSRMYKTFGGEKWKTNVLLTALLCPGIVFADFFFMNLILWVKGSSAAIPFGTLVAILAMWIGISVPLTFIGAYFGFKGRPVEQPVPTNQIPRQIPVQSFFRKSLPGIIMGGILPFGCICNHLFFILNSMWNYGIYYSFGFLFLVFVILLLTCSEATILLCYFHLCSEDYHWWWRSFLSSSFTAVYLCIYVLHFFFSKLQITGLASTIVYFGYTMIMVFICFLCTGTIGFFACYWFVRKIYSVVKRPLDFLPTTGLSAKFTVL